MMNFWNEANGWQWIERTFSVLPAAIYVCDTTGALQYYNSRAVELWGEEPTEPCAMDPLGDHLALFDRDGHRLDAQRTPMAQALRTGRGQRSREVVLEQANGSRIDVSVDVEPVLGGDGELLGAISILHDITDRRRGEDAEILLSALVETSDDAIYGKTLDGIITHWNVAAERLYGYAADEIVGRSIEVLVPPDRSAELRDTMNRLRRGQRLATFETERCHKSGSRIHVSVTVSPIRDRRGGLVGASAIARDISPRLQAETHRRELEERFGQLAENIADVFYIRDVDPPMHVSYVSKAYERIWGRTPESLYAEPESFFDVVHPDDHDRVRRALRRQATGEATAEEYRIVRPDGRMRWIWDRAFAIRDRHGALVRVTGVAEDITERKRIEEGLRFLAEASRSLAELVDYESTLQKIASLAVPCFADWCAVHMSEGKGRMRQLAVAHGDPKKITLAHHLARCYPADTQAPAGAAHVLQTGISEMADEVTDELLQSLARDPDHLELLRALGVRSYICVPLSVRGNVVGAITFVAAESGRGYTSVELAMANDLAHRASVAIENARLYAEQRAEGKRKDEFLAMLAHELRNPLAPIRSGLDVLQLTGMHADIVETMQQQVTHLVRLVDDLLDISRIMRGKVQLRREPVRLSDVVRRGVEAVRDFIAAQGHHLTTSLPAQPIYVDGDSVRLTQVFANLLHNAAKYTEPGGDIRIALSQRDGQAAIEVQDSGIGIDRQLLPHVFDLFTQADRSLERSQGGLGIGLTLVQSLVEMHGGTVEAASEGEGLGSVFTVQLPVMNDVAAGPPASSSWRAPGAVRFLIVDDNQDAARMLAMLLHVLGKYEVHVAHDGPSALDVAREQNPEVMLLDIGLPGMNGYELARKLRADGTFRPALLVAVTGYGSAEDQRRSLEAGFDLHLVKPLSVEAFQQILNHPKLAQAPR